MSYWCWVTGINLDDKERQMTIKWKLCVLTKKVKLGSITTKYIFLSFRGIKMEHAKKEMNKFTKICKYSIWFSVTISLINCSVLFYQTVFDILSSVLQSWGHSSLTSLKICSLVFLIHSDFFLHHHLTSLSCFLFPTIECAWTEYANI